MKQDRLEEQIIHEIRRYKSDDILIALHSALKDLSDPKNIGHRFLPNGLPPFVTAGIASFAVRFSNPYRNALAFGWPALASIASLVSQYLLNDPICFDTELAEKFNSENPSFVILRTFASQTLFEYNQYACFSQPLMMYGEIAQKIKNKKGIPYFDFHCEFEEAVGASLMDFTSICFIAVSAARGNTTGFTRGYFEKARQEGLRIPDDKTTLAILNSIAATPEKFRDIYEVMKVKDRRFRAYDFNPLMMYPVIRPWKDKHLFGIDSDRLIAPIPALIPYRASVGIYYEMFNKHDETFTKWFGHVFEAYVGEILENSIYGPKLISEDAIQKTYKKGKLNFRALH